MNTSAFITRFDRIWARARRVQFSQAILWGVLTAVAGVALLAAIDFAFELPHGLRLGALIAIGAAAIAVAITLVSRSAHRWRRQATAATIEEVFPQLGQRIRTTIQFGPLSEGQMEEAGVATTLVAALEDDTVRRAQPLPLDAVVPWRSLAIASLLAAVTALALAGASALNWEWRAAASRAFLGDQPYTNLEVQPGNLTVKEGESAKIRVIVEGRTDKPIFFRSRRTDEAKQEWEETELSPDDAEALAERRIEFEVPLDRVRHPLEYQVTAGAVTSDAYCVNVLYPLKIATIRSTLTPPAYTGLKPAATEGGHITGLVGSQVSLEIELDRAPESAWLEIRDTAKRSPDEPAVRKVPLDVQGSKLTAALELTVDQTYSLFAKAADGMELPENRQRIRVRQDEAPRVWFESPSEALEVHSLAEIMMRVRVSDDFGLTRAGIMFEVNNEEEYPLVAEDFQAAADGLETAEKEIAATGELSPQTRATLEKVLPLEHFDLTQQDSVMYYAFAEDNLPGVAHRTESDLRFIDIRPFRRLYRVVDDDMPMGQGAALKSLEELIARQRYALNRTVQLARRFERSGQIDLSGVDSLIKFEAELASFTRELAEGLEALGIGETELLYQAETAMLGASDSLSAGSYDTATLQERDALKYLIEGRDRLQVFIQKNPNRQMLAQLRRFDRTQQQKLRRPKTDEQEAREAAERLEELAEQEEFVYKTLAGVPMIGDQQSQGEGEPGERPQTPEDLEDRQLDIALEAREIEKVLGRLDGVTDLAKERIAGAAKTAEDAAAALAKKEMEGARSSAQAAAKDFRELSEQVKALLAEEQAERIAAAQQMASELAQQQQDFADRLAKSQQQSGAGGEKPGEENKGQGKGGLGGEAEEIAEKAQTLNDVLGAAAKADDPQDQASAQRVQELIGSLKIPELTERLTNLPQQVAGGQMQDAQANAGDGAERLEAAAEQLAVLHRSIVAPQIDELAKLEEKLVGLDTELEELETPTDITAWHMEANALLEELEDAGLSQEERKGFLEEMKKQGWGPDVRRSGWGWGRLEGGYYTAPGAYKTILSRLLGTVRGRMQELMLTEMASSGDEPIPPQYQELVDRYQQVLSAESATDPAARATE